MLANVFTQQEEEIKVDIPDILFNDEAQFICISGKAGTGKSTLMKAFKKEYVNNVGLANGIQTSTTGISACNINGVTIHSLLGVYDRDSWINAHKTNKLQEKLRAIRDRFSAIYIDEIYMLGATAFDLLLANVHKYNTLNPGRSLRVIMTGDAGQLEPVKDQPIFEANYWPFINKITLDKVHRQNDPDFLEAINHLREGNPELAVDYFYDVIKFNPSISKEHPGLILQAKNIDVDRENYSRLAELSTQEMRYKNSVTDKRFFNDDDGDIIRKYKLPEELVLKKEAPVMCLVNALRDGYANGDLGKVLDFDRNGVVIKLLRNGAEVFVTWAQQEDAKQNVIKYMPLRLAYSSTIHKIQSLTTDAIQLVLQPGFIGKSHGMGYTAITRVRTPQGLRIVCKSKEDFCKCFYTNKAWLKYM